MWLPYTFIEMQPLTRSPPTLPTEGQPLKPFRGGAVTVVVEAPEGQTLSAGGRMECWVWDDVVNGWCRLKSPGIDCAITVNGIRRQMFPSVMMSTPRDGKILWASNGIVTSGGTGIKLYQLGYVEGSFSRNR